mgnify:CR=1 FL=1
MLDDAAPLVSVEGLRVEFETQDGPVTGVEDGVDLGGRHRRDGEVAAPHDRHREFIAVEVFADELRQAVRREVGPVADFRDVVVVDALPKTRSGKILRRLLAQLWQDDPLGDITSLQNPWAVDGVREAVRAARQKETR